MSHEGKRAGLAFGVAHRDAPSLLGDGWVGRPGDLELVVARGPSR
jgi:hypothetical protein